MRHIITRAEGDDNVPASFPVSSQAPRQSDSALCNSLDPEHEIAYRIEKI